MSFVKKACCSILRMLGTEVFPFFNDTTVFLHKGSNKQVGSGADAGLDELFFWPKFKESENTAWMLAAEEASVSFWKRVSKQI